MLDRFLASPFIALGFVLLIFLLILVYLGQRERAAVDRMRGPRRFSPRWSSGRSHRSRRRRSEPGFQPRWDRDKRRERSRVAGGEAGNPEQEPGDERS